MHFAFISTMAGYPWGGSEELWSQTALRLRGEGHHVAASVPWWPRLSPRVTGLAAQGVELFVRPPAQASLPVRLWRKVGRRCGVTPPELRWLLRQKPDLICVSNGNYRDGLNFLEVCLQNGVPYVSVVQANAEFVWPSDSDAERLIAAYQGACRAFFVSQRNRLLLETQLGIRLQNTQVVRNPFNVRWEASVPWPAESDGWKLACVARLEPPAKGQDLVAQVLASDAWRSRPVSLSLLGTGPMEQGLRRLVLRLGLEDRVRFAGQVSDIEQLWAAHHALVLPSRYEGLPLALVEAMLCARPAIVTDVAGNTELVEDGKTGFVAAAPTAQHLNEAMERAWARRRDWQTMGVAAQLRARSEVPANPAEVFAEELLQLAQHAA